MRDLTSIIARRREPLPNVPVWLLTQAEELGNVEYRNSLNGSDRFSGLVASGEFPPIPSNSALKPSASGTPVTLGEAVAATIKNDPNQSASHVPKARSLARGFFLGRFPVNGRAR